MRCCPSASFLPPIGGRLHRRPRRQQTRSTAPQTVQHRPPFLVPVRVILGCGWMLAIIMLEQRVVGVVGLEAAGSRIRIPNSTAPGAWLGHEPGDTKGQLRSQADSRDLAMTNANALEQQRPWRHAVYGMQEVRGCDASCLA